MIKKFLLLTILLFTYCYSYADIKVYIDPTSIVSGQSGKLFVKVDGFTNVTGFQLNMKWDVTKLGFVEVGDLGSLSMNADNDFTAFPNGNLRATWAEPQSGEASLANGSILFSVTFSGICGSTSLVDIINDGFFTVQFNDTNGDIIPHTSQSGAVTVTGTPCGGAQTVVKLPAVNAPSGEKVCVDVLSGPGFTNITGLTFDLNISSGCVAFNEVGNFNGVLNGLSAGNFNVSQAGNGVVKLTWTSATSTTIGPNVKLFDICYTPNESCCGTVIPITFSNVTITTSGGGTNNLTETGSLNITCGTTPDCDPDGLALIASDHCALPGEIITMDFTVQSFSQIGGMQFSIDWDPTCLALETEGIIIPPNKPVTGLVPGKFSIVNSGCVIVLWDETGGESVTLPDGTLIFSLKFKVLGSLGNNCSVNIGDHCLTSGMEFLNEEGAVIPATTCSGDVQVKDCNQGVTIVDKNVKNSTCAEPCDGAIEFTVTGAVNPTITWSQAGLSGSSVTGLCAGTYSVTVTSGASTVSKSYTITAPNAINVSTASVTPATNGNNGAIDINVSGGSGSFSYLWSTNPAVTTQDVSSLAVGSYTVTVTDTNNGCKKTLTVSVTDGTTAFDATVTAKKYGEFDLTCSTACDAELTATPSGGTAPYTFKWSYQNATTQTISGVCTGTYNVTVTDNTNKSVTKTYVVLTPVKLLINFDIVYPTDDQTSDGSISAEPVGGSSPYTYNWSGSVVSTQQELSNVGVGTYSVVVTDRNGCSATGAKTLTPGGKGCYEGIGAITPNNDGKNDRLLITCASSVSNRLIVFNRWGQKVFEQASYNNGWEGTDDKGENLPDGGYFWVLEVKESNGSTEVFKGSVSIIRSLR